MYKAIFIFILFFSVNVQTQVLKDTLSRFEIHEIELRNENIKKRKAILLDFQGLEYSDLINIIINDIDFKKLKSENLVFDFRNTCSLERDNGFGSVLYSNFICESDSENPAFNQNNFWTPETIRTIQKKHAKNIIPFLQRLATFVTDSTEYESFDERIKFYYFDESKKIIDEAKRSSKGVYKEKSGNNGYEYEKPIYYFSGKGKDENLVLTNISGNNNFDKLYMSFANFKDKIVVVKYQYDFDIKKTDIYKVYQFQKKKWRKIPYKEEYKINY